jgi:outer membrane protein TolC
MKFYKLTPFLFLIIFAFSADVLFAQQSFTLVQAQEYALKNNYNNKNARIDIDIAKKKVWETTSIGLPQINGKIAYQNIFTVPVMNFSTPYLITDPDPEKMKLGYKEYPIELGVKDNWTYSLTASQLIFNGSYFVGLKTSKTFKRFSQEALTKSETDIKENVANAYYLALTLEESKRLLDSSMVSLQHTLYEMTEMCKMGFIENTDTDQMSLNVSNLKNTILSVNNQLTLAYQLLRYQMGMKVTENIVLADKLDDVISQIKAEDLLAATFDLNSNINYQLLSTQEKLSELNYKYEISKSLPTIAAFYQHQELGQKPAFNFNPPDVLGISIDIPLFSSGGRAARISQSKMALEKAGNTKQQVAEGLQMEALQAQSDLKLTLDKYINEKNNLMLSKRIYEKTLTKYKEGVSSSMDLTQANMQFLTAQSNYYQSVMKLLTAKNKMERILSKN